MRQILTNSPDVPPTATIDWPAVTRRLANALSALDGSTAPDAAETRRILQARARALARPPCVPPADGEAIELAEFQLAQERYALETRFVREICPLEHLTPLPCVPAFVLGIVNLRGEIVSVIDLKVFFDLPSTGITDLNKLLVLEVATMRFGVLADAVLGVRSVPVAEIQDARAPLSGIRGHYLRGVTTTRTAVLDAEALAGDPAIVVQEQPARPAVTLGLPGARK